ncbi:ATP-binding protein [Rhodophyticola sp. CCM32]|uniref:ATP-binding protein n=1 Tax=Rhodophyticola sp. CCM32 TaxID=2916397 RepID=UPI00107F0649|nr:ATP-binding protein [Rhodophyticola sp. CCM32]QBY01236.1 ATP-binding protein [Rhodophyticola sp. CCM32]
MHHSFDLPPQLDEVDKAVQALRALVEPVLEPEQASCFEVAVSEALTNIVVHGYEGIQGGKTVSVQLDTDGQVLRLTIIDHGTPGPADLFETGPSLDEIDFMEESGRGLALIRHHADAVAYTPSVDGNRLILTFCFPVP